MATAFSRIGAAAGTFLLPLGIGPYMLVAAALTAAGLVVSYLLAPETTGQTLSVSSAVRGADPTPAT